MVLSKTQVQRYVVARPQTDSESKRSPYLEKWSETKVIDRTAKIFLPSESVQQQKVPEVPEHGENNRMAKTRKRKLNMVTK